MITVLKLLPSIPIFSITVVYFRRKRISFFNVFGKNFDRKFPKEMSTYITLKEAGRGAGLTFADQCPASLLRFEPYMYTPKPHKNKVWFSTDKTGLGLPVAFSTLRTQNLVISELVLFDYELQISVRILNRNCTFSLTTFVKSLAFSLRFCVLFATETSMTSISI